MIFLKVCNYYGDALQYCYSNNSCSGEHHQYDGIILPELKRRRSVKIKKLGGASGAFNKNQEISLRHYFEEIKLELLAGEFPANCTIERTSDKMLHVFNQLFQSNVVDLLPEHQSNSAIQQSVRTRTVKDLPEVCTILGVVCEHNSKSISTNMLHIIYFACLDQ